MKELTARQREVLAFITSYIERHKYPPSVRELSDHFSITPKGGYDHLKALEKKHYIRCADHRSRAIEVLDPTTPSPAVVQVPLLGTVAAGLPLFAEENHDGVVPVAADLIGSGDHFALRVQGDSMRDAGILDGDLAVVRHQPSADNGDIVVAMIEEAVTLKRFFRESNRVRLAAENADFPPIFTRDVKILGKLRAVLRAY